MNFEKYFLANPKIFFESGEQSAVYISNPWLYHKESILPGKEASTPPAPKFGISPDELHTFRTETEALKRKKSKDKRLNDFYCKLHCRT